MPILTDSQRAALAARLAEPDCAGLDDAAAAGVLNAPTAVANPDPRPTIPRVISGREVLGLLSPASYQAIQAGGYLPHLDQLAWDQQRGRLVNWIDDILVPAGVTAEDAAAVKAYLAATDPDPDWPATVPGPSWAQSALGAAEFPLPGGGSLAGYVTPEMVAEARA